MAPPNGENVMISFPRPSPKNDSKLSKLSSEDNLKRSVSDIAFELSKEIDRQLEESRPLLIISEAEDAKCECCGMIEEYTPEYIRSVRDKFLGKWVCGLCSEAVKEEMEKNGGNCKEGLETHMNHCVRFNKIRRAYPVLCQAEAMRKILKKRSMVRAKLLNNTNSRDGKGLNKGAIARSSSCMPSMMNDVTIND